MKESQELEEGWGQGFKSLRPAAGGGQSHLRSSVTVPELCLWQGLRPGGQGHRLGGLGVRPWGLCHPPTRPAAATVPCSPTATSGKKQAAKSKEELAQEKKKELERRLQDVSGQLGNSKKPAKRGGQPRAARGGGGAAGLSCGSAA